MFGLSGIVSVNYISLSGLSVGFIGFIGLSGLLVYRVLSFYRVYWFIGLSVYRVYRFIGFILYWVYRFIGFILYRVYWFIGFIGLSGLSVYRVYPLSGCLSVYYRPSVRITFAGPWICKACQLERCGASNSFLELPWHFSHRGAGIYYMC